MMRIPGSAKKNFILVITAVFITLSAGRLSAQENCDTSLTRFSRHSLETTPMMPFINIYALQYGYSFDEKNDLILGLAYMTIPHENVGRTHASSLIIGYRRNFGSGWHAEYSVYPMYDNYFEINERKYYNGIDIWNEFRFGYQYDFTVSDIPVFVKAQLPFGFALYAQNKPKSFLDREKEGDNRFFYKAVMLFCGIKF